MKKYSKSETPSLGKNQEWRPTSGPSPFRPPLPAGERFPPWRNVDGEWALRWVNPTTSAKAAKSKNASPYGK
jgi:hypothetical protein